MSDQNVDTKAKIVQVARILFADQGFEGTSIREIATKAEVNVASVNYHFSNKENLFAEILRTSYRECAAEMRNLFNKNNGNLEDTLVDFFQYFLDNSHDLITHFKMMMSSQHSHHVTSKDTDDGMFGPPGGQVIFEAIQKEVGTKVHESDLHWALKTLFSHVTHASIIHNCCMKTNSPVPYSTVEDFKKSIRRLTKIVIKDLKHP